MSRILDGIMKFRQTLRPSLLEELVKVANGPSVRAGRRTKRIDRPSVSSLKVFFSLVSTAVSSHLD